MPSVMVRISENSRNILRKLADREGQSMQTILDKSIEYYRRQKFLEEINAAYATLRQDSKAWKTIEQERSQWDATISDGLKNDENKYM